MEYERTEDGQIQAEFSRRAGQILLQYEQLSADLPASERYEATLAVSLLQSLLTSCQELIRTRRSKALGAVVDRLMLDEPALMGLEADCILQSWPSRRGLTYREVFECLRNALSHPGPQGNSRYARTGFTTEHAGSASVSAYVFTESSWINSKGSSLLARYSPRACDEASRLALEAAVRSWASNHAVEGVLIAQNGEGHWRAYLGNELFVPVLQLRLGVQQLRTLTLILSDYLAEPLRAGVGVSV